jgi:hypothetical protein
MLDMGTRAKFKGESMRFLDAYKPQVEKYWGEDLDYRIDPRPDLEEDSALWTQLLTNSVAIDIEVTRVLHAIRGGGTLLMKQGDRYVLKPLIDSKTGWESPEDYAKIRDTYMLPHKDQIIELLKEFGPEP